MLDKIVEVAERVVSSTTSLDLTMYIVYCEQNRVYVAYRDQCSELMHDFSENNNDTTILGTARKLDALKADIAVGDVWHGDDADACMQKISELSEAIRQLNADYLKAVTDAYETYKGLSDEVISKARAFVDGLSPEEASVALAYWNVRDL